MKHEFDEYIHNYRETLDQAVAISGESSAFFAEYKAKKLYEWFPQKNKKGISILDFGCGDGLMASFVKVFFPHAKIFGVDPSQESIEFAQEAHPSISFSVSNEHIPFPDNTFDLMYAAGVFHHIPFSEHKKYFDEIHRVLKSQGIFVLFELNPLNPLTQWIFRHNPIDKNAQMLWPWYAKKILKKYGAVSLKYYCFFPRLLSKLRPIEPYMIHIPVGALYACILNKK